MATGSGRNPVVSMIHFDGDDAPPPLGFKKLSEIFCRAQWLRWTHRWYDRDKIGFGSFGDLVGGGGLVSDVELDGQFADVAQILIEAAIEGEISPFMEKDGSRFEVTPSAWRGRPLLDWELDIRWNVISPHSLGEMLGEPISGLKGMEGARLLVDGEAAAEWLARLDRPLVLPDPLKRDPANLPLRPRIGYCEAVTWLADGTALDKDAERAALGDALLLLETIATESRAGVDQEELTRRYKTQLAEMFMWDARRIEARKMVLQSVLARDMTALGAAEGSDEVCEVPEDEWLSDVSPSLIYESFVVQDNAAVHSDADRLRNPSLTPKAGWSNLQFERRELVKVFGHSPKEVPEDSRLETGGKSGRRRGGQYRHDHSVIREAFISEYALSCSEQELTAHDVQRAIKGIVFKTVHANVQQTIGLPEISEDTVRRALKLKS